MMVTRADLKGRPCASSAHIDGSGWSGWHMVPEGIPRLSVLDIYDKKTRERRQTWSVDHVAVKDLDTALAVLNGEKTLQQAMQELEEPAPLKGARPKISLVAQIAEVDYELKQREDVYKRIAINDPGRRSELELHVQRLEAVKATLLWLEENERLIKQRCSY